MKNFLIIIISIITLLSADTIYLTNGKELSGEITVQENQFTVNGIVVPDERVEYLEKDGQHYSAEYYRQNFSAKSNLESSINEVIKQSTAQANNYRPKRITIKTIYQPGTELDYENSDSVYDNGYSIGFEERGHFDVDGGFGLGAELSVYDSEFGNNYLELIGGFNYMLTRDMPKLRGKITIHDYSGDHFASFSGDTSERLSLMSFYAKPRLLFSKPTSDNTVGYLAGKLSYNQVSITGDLDIELMNSLGLGISTGAIINDTLDCEIAWEYLAGNLEVNASSKGTYDMSTLSLSLGLRI